MSDGVRVRVSIPGAQIYTPGIPGAHAATHATGQPDAISPASIGAAPTIHAHVVSDVTGLSVSLAGKLDSTDAAIGVAIAGAGSKPSPVDADKLVLADSAAANIAKSISVADLKTALQSPVEAPLVGKIYGLTSVECTLYWPAIVNGYSRFGFDPALANVTCAVVRNGVRIDEPDASTGMLSVYANDLATLAALWTATTAVEVIDAASLSGETITVLAVGDSLTSQANVTSRMATLATSLGFTVDGVGTQGTAPNQHEGHPGWSWASFNGASSPFFSSGSLNWTAYFTANGTPDVVTWLLGTNDVLGAINGLTLSAAVSAATSIAASAAADAEELIEAALAVAPTTMHVLLLPPTGTTGASGFGANYGIDRPQHIYHAAMLAYREAFAAAFANREVDGIYVAELGALIDPENGAQQSAVTISAYNSGTITESTNGVHYSTAGYVEMSAAQLPAVCGAYLARPTAAQRVISFSTTAPYVRTWEYAAGVLTEYDGATWDPSSAPGTYQSDARASLAVPANSSVTSGELTGGDTWVTSSRGNRPSPSTVLCVAIHPNGQYVAYGLQVSPWLRIHKWDGAAWSNLDLSGMTPPTDRVYGLAWSNDGTRLAVGKYGSSALAIYNWSADTLSNRVTPASQPSGTTVALAWRHDDSAIALGNLSSPYLDAYTRSGDTYTKVSNPATLPGGNARHVAWSPDGSRLACAVQHANALIWYSWSAGSLAALTNPASMPSGSASGICWMDNDHLAVGHDGASGAAYIRSYSVSGGLLIADPDPVPLTALSAVVTTLRKF